MLKQENFVLKKHKFVLHLLVYGHEHKVYQLKVVLYPKKDQLFRGDQNQLNFEINNLSMKLKSISIKNILNIMGYPYE